MSVTHDYSVDRLYYREATTHSSLLNFSRKPYNTFLQTSTSSTHSAERLYHGIPTLRTSGLKLVINTRTSFVTHNQAVTLAPHQTASSTHRPLQWQHTENTAIICLPCTVNTRWTSTERMESEPPEDDQGTQIRASYCTTPR